MTHNYSFLVGSERQFEWRLLSQKYNFTQYKSQQDLFIRIFKFIRPIDKNQIDVQFKSNFDLRNMPKSVVITLLFRINRRENAKMEMFCTLLIHFQNSFHSLTRFFRFFGRR